MFGELPIEQILESAGYIAIFGLMITNGLFSFPSSQLLYIATGYFVSTGHLGFATAALIGALGNSVGNYALFYLTREKGLKLSLIHI